MNANTTELHRVAPDLWETAAEAPFPGLTTHAYMWTGSPKGNVLFYSPGTDAQLGELARLGGVTHQYLSHRDEAGPMLDVIAAEFASVLHAPSVEAREIGRHRRPDVLFTRREVDEQLVEVVPTPGHSPGSTCFLVHGADGRYLFTGDTIYRSEDGSWVAGNLPGLSDPASLDASLEVLAGLAPDLVVSSAFTGDSAVQRFVGGEWQDRVARARQDLAASVR